MRKLSNRRQARYLRRAVGEFAPDAGADQRRQASVVHKARKILTAILVGLLTGRKGFAEMEELTEELSTAIRRELGVSQRVADNTARYLTERIDVVLLRRFLRRQAKAAYRRKSLSRLGKHAPIKMVSIDGKTSRGKTQADDESVVHRFPYFQADEDRRGKWLHGDVRTLSVALVSAPATVYLDCVPIRAETNEMGAFLEALEQLVKDWGNTDLFELVSVDAGMTSLKHATAVDEAGFGYLMAIKGPQQELQSRLYQLLGPTVVGRPDAETVEQYQGKTVVYRVWRTREIAGWLEWSHLRQGIRIERTVISDDPNQDDTVEQRY